MSDFHEIVKFYRSFFEVENFKTLEIWTNFEARDLENQNISSLFREIFKFAKILTIIDLQNS